MVSPWRCAFLHLQKRVDGLEEKINKYENLERVEIKVASISIDLPDHLRLTYDKLRFLGYSNASTIAQLTKRHRALESSHLCELERIGIVEANRIGHEVYFKLKDNGGSIE
jgi:hypothetical protein